MKTLLFYGFRVTYWGGVICTLEKTNTNFTMKNSLMKYGKITLFVLGSVFLATNCSRQDEPLPEVVNAIQENEAVYLEHTPLVSERVTLEELPELNEILISKIGVDALSSKGKKAVIDRSNIIKIIDEEGNKNFTMRFWYKKAPPNTFYNLVVNKNKKGKSKEAYVMSFTVDPLHMQAFLTSGKDGGMDFSQFSGAINVHPYQHFFKDGRFGKSDCPTVYAPNGDPISCEEIEMQNGGSPGGSQNGSYNTQNHGSQGSITVYHVIPDGRVYRFGSGSICHHPGECTIVFVVEDGENQDNKSSANDCTECTAFSAGGTGVNYSSAVGALGFKLQLDNTKKLFLQRNYPTLAKKINDNMNANGNSWALRNHAKDIVNSLFDGIAVSPTPLIKYPENLAAEYREDYPKLTEYLMNQLPKLVNNATIVNTFKKYTNMTTAQIKETLTWGDGPIIKIKQLGSVLGRFKEPNILEIDIDLVNDLENAQSGSRYSESVLFFVAVTVLHEAIHFGDYENNDDYWTGNRFPFEEGWLFENEAYGGAVHITKDGGIEIMPFN